MSVPVYDEHGELFATSVAGAARIFKVRSSSLVYHHLIDYRDGYQLKSRPDPKHIGRRGGPRVKPRPVLGPRGERWISMKQAAKELGCVAETVRRLGQRRGDSIYLPCYPTSRGVKHGSRTHLEQSR